MKPRFPNASFSRALVLLAALSLAVGCSSPENDESGVAPREAVSGVDENAENAATTNAVTDGPPEGAEPGLNFDTACSEVTDGGECFTCCDERGADLGLVENDACGCAVKVTNAEVCAASTDSPSCTTCCSEFAGDSMGVFGGFNGARDCVCHRKFPYVE